MLTAFLTNDGTTFVSGEWHITHWMQSYQGCPHSQTNIRQRGAHYIQVTALSTVPRIVSVEDVPLVEFMYLVFSHMPSESYNRRLRSLLCLWDIFGALMNSLVCWFCASVSKEQCGACGKLLSAYRMVNCVYIMYMFAYLHVHYQLCRSYYITIVSCCFWYVICKSVFITHWARIKE